MELLPEECKVGMHVWYEPSPGRQFLGIVAEKPWQLGDGTWVTKLRGMEPAYADFTHKSGDKATTVYAASLCRCFDAGHFVEVPPAPHQPERSWKNQPT